VGGAEIVLVTKGKSKKGKAELNVRCEANRSGGHAGTSHEPKKDRFNIRGGRNVAFKELGGPEQKRTSLRGTRREKIGARIKSEQKKSPTDC